MKETVVSTIIIMLKAFLSFVNTRFLPTFYVIRMRQRLFHLISSTHY